LISGAARWCSDTGSKWRNEVQQQPHFPMR
jgi:hypothetical protein